MGSIISSFGSIAGGLVGQAAASGDRANAQNEAQNAAQILQNIGQAPDISKPLLIEQYKQAGLLTPEMEQQISAGPSALQGVQTDQSSLDAQRQALQQLQQRSTEGLSAGDRAALAQAQVGTQAATQGKIGQILQQSQAQNGGAGRSGNTLAAELSAAQNGSNQMASNANQQAQIASANALNATSQSGQLGGQINSQQFGQAAQKASAADQMARFNTQNALGVQQANTQASNQAQAGNLANAQALSNANTGAYNQEQANQLKRQMEQYGANVNTAQVQAGGQTGLSNFNNNLGNSIATQYANLGSGAGQAGGAAYDQASSSGGKSSGGGDVSDAESAFSNGGRVPSYFQGGMASFKQGGHVPGKAQYSGDHPANDTVHAMLSPGEIVVPRSLAESKIGKEMLKLINAHNAVKGKMNGQD